MSLTPASTNAQHPGARSAVRFFALMTPDGLALSLTKPRAD